jgi:DNA-binding response OmpR family regulator
MCGSNKEHLLVVEDDIVLSTILKDNFGFHGFRVECVRNGELALACVRQATPDLVILDISLPDADGFDLCPLLSHGGRVPVLMLTARGQKADKVRGFGVGADDYMTKPFDIDELLARVKALLRRARPALTTLDVGEVRINFQTLTAVHNRRPLNLSHREFEVLQYLASRPGRVVHRDQLLRDVWGFQSGSLTRSVDNAISRLRKKIEPDTAHPRFIHSVYGDGYVFTPEGHSAPREEPHGNSTVSE